ncbi:MAG TPA: O-antigen ligase family protein [Candidatus Omnitrophota bacterium]|nr:O-antigen ligase family protein [Candidatus Omnitrophota bacterium]
MSVIIIRPFVSSVAYPYADLLLNAAGIAVFIVLLIAKQPVLQRFSSVAYPAGVFIAGISLSLITSSDIAGSIIELFKSVPCLLAFIAAAYLDGRERKAVMFAAMCAAALVCLCALYQRIFGFGNLARFIADTRTTSPVALNYLTGKRVFFPFVTPNSLGGYCAMALPLCFTEKRFYWIAVPLSAVILLTQSLGALFALLTAVYLCVFLMPSRKTAWQMALISGLLAVLILVFWIRISGRSLETAAPGLARLEYWRETLSVIREHPLLGTGIGNMRLRSSIYSHNAFLQLWAETGILGLGGFIWLCFAVLRNAFRRFYARKDASTALLLCSCMVFLLHNLFDFTFSLPEVSFLWWLLMGMLL